MGDQYKKIYLNPVGGNAFYRYDVVYLGRTIPNYVNCEEARKLHDEYILIFSTYLNEKDGTRHGSTYINIEQEYKISHFDRDVVEQTHFHTLPESFDVFEINPFVEIHKTNSENGFTIFARLKKQEVLGSKREVISVKDKDFILVRENLKFENESVITLNERFHNQIKIDTYEEITSRIEASISEIKNYLKPNDEEEEEAIKKVKEMLEERLEKFKVMEKAHKNIYYDQFY